MSDHEYPNEVFDGYDANEKDNDVENDDLQEYDEIYDADDDVDEWFTRQEKDVIMYRKIGMQLLAESTMEELDDLYYLLQIKEKYGVSLSTVMGCASERIADVYSVGETYLTPLFKLQRDKEQYIIKKLIKWDKYSNGKPVKYDEKRILIDIYNVPRKYASFALKFLYECDKYETRTLKDKIRNMLENIKKKMNSSKFLTKDEIFKYNALFKDVVEGSRGNNLRWLMVNNQVRSRDYAKEEMEDVQIDSEASFTIHENIEIMAYVVKINKILSQDKINLNDKEELDRMFAELNEYTVLARNRYLAEQEAQKR